MSTTYRGQGSAHAWTTLDVAEAASRWRIVDLPPRSPKLLENSTATGDASASLPSQLSPGATPNESSPVQPVLPSSLHVGMIVGVAIGGLSTLALVIGLIVLCVLRQRKEAKNATEPESAPAPAPLPTSNTNHHDISSARNNNMHGPRSEASQTPQPKELGEDANVQTPSSAGMTLVNSPAEILTQIHHQLPTERDARAVELA